MEKVLEPRDLELDEIKAGRILYEANENMLLVLLSHSNIVV